MSIENKIESSEELVRWIDGKLGGLKLPSNIRSRIAAGCLDIALEHQKAIITLVQSKLYSSAFALLRTNFESHVRGLWFLHCASEADIERFKKKGHIGRQFKDLISDIEKIEAFSNGALSKAHKQSWSSLNDFAHSGKKQIAMRNKEFSIAPNYVEKDISTILEFGNTTSILSAIALAELSKKQHLANEIYNKGHLFWADT